VDDTKLSGMTDILEGRDDIQRDYGRMERWTHANLMKFNMAKYKFLHMGWGNPITNTGWAENGLKAALWRRTWGHWLMRNSL